MMKKVMFALCFMFGGIVAVTAQDTQDTTSNQYRTETQSQNPAIGQDQQSQNMMGQQDRERIQVTELPDEVKRSLEGQEYRGWLISGAFKAQDGDQSSMEGDTTKTDAAQQESVNATEAEGEQVYIVELKNGAETKTVRFNSNGEIVEGMEDERNSQFNQDVQTPENDQNPNNQLNQDNQMNETETDPATPQPDQSQSSQSADPSQSESTGTPTGQSKQTETQTEQSKANEPK